MQGLLWRAVCQVNCMDEVLAQVRSFADKAHGDQTRKYTPERYIVHPVRVMELCRQHHQTLAVLCAALLHDILEDTPVSRQEIYSFLIQCMPTDEAHQTIELVVELTDVYTKQNYPAWNRKKRRAAEAQRIAHTSADAQTIKYADIIDNCREIVQHDPDFARVFLRECRALLDVMPNGLPALYHLAKEQLQASQNQLRERT